MKRSDELRQRLVDLKALKDRKYHEIVTSRIDPTMEGWDAAWKEYYERCGRTLENSIREMERLILVELNREHDVGDGATLCLYTDREACTVIAKTKTTITLQRDKATLDKGFKPDWVVGGFSAHCTNQDEQKWTYERDPNGEITKCYWSERLGRYTTGGDQSVRVMPGRHEFYDYNF